MISRGVGPRSEVAVTSTCRPADQRSCVRVASVVSSFGVEGSGRAHCAKELREVVAAVPFLKTAIRARVPNPA